MSATEPATSAPTLAEWVASAGARMADAGLFFGHGTAEARDEACWIVSSALGWPPDFPPERFDETIPADQQRLLERLVDERIATRKPLAYLLGEAWFAGLSFVCDPRALVPRSPLAELIVDGLKPWLDLARPLRVLDVGTGSGCIACALAYHWPALQVDAVDISIEAAELARTNVERLGLRERVRVACCDVYPDLTDRAAADGGPAHEARRYDLIVSNPPYVPDASMQTLPEEYRHEPALGLRAGSDGLDIVRRLLAGAPDRLVPNGYLLMEVGEAQPQTEALLGPVDAVWLEFEHGGEGVVLLDRDACRVWKERNA
jgi:ribosomal protein L3 glutamine methyltransferase